jgi:hypothetical protein
MDKKDLNKENHCPPVTFSNIAPIVELPVNDGAWLKIEEDTNSTGINYRICSKTLVSLHVTMEESEHECSLAPFCKNHPIRKCLKDQELTKRKNIDYNNSEGKPGAGINGN